MIFVYLDMTFLFSHLLIKFCKFITLGMIPFLCPSPVPAVAVAALCSITKVFDLDCGCSGSFTQLRALRVDFF